MTQKRAILLYGEPQHGESTCCTTRRTTTRHTFYDILVDGKKVETVSWKKGTHPDVIRQHLEHDGIWTGEIEVRPKTSTECVRAIAPNWMTKLIRLLPGRRSQ